MSLSKLPDLLKKQICAFLDFNDIKNLEQINKKTQYFLKRYKLDKPKIYCLQIATEYDEDDDENYIGCVVILEEGSESIDLPNLKEIDSKKILQLINEFHSIEKLFLGDFTLPKSSAWKTIQTKIRFGIFRCVNLYASRKTIISFFKQFKQIKFNGDLKCSYINDQFFAELCENGTTMLFNGVSGKVDLTDVTLDILSKKYIPKELSMNYVDTDFTLTRIKRMIEDALTSGMTEIKWNFGTMKFEQYPEVRKFVYEEFKDWSAGFKMPLIFDHELYVPVEAGNPENEHYTIHHSDKSQDDFSISFSVRKSEEIVGKKMEQDSDDERSSKDDSSSEDEEMEFGEDDVDSADEQFESGEDGSGLENNEMGDDSDEEEIFYIH